MSKAFSLPKDWYEQIASVHSIDCSRFKECTTCKEHYGLSATQYCPKAYADDCLEAISLLNGARPYIGLVALKVEQEKATGGTDED